MIHACDLKVEGSSSLACLQNPQAFTSINANAIPLRMKHFWGVGGRWIFSITVEF